MEGLGLLLFAAAVLLQSWTPSLTTQTALLAMLTLTPEALKGLVRIKHDLFSLEILTT